MATSSTFAVFADVHGNSWALDAILADLRRRAPDLARTRLLNLGDCFYGPLDPAGTAERLLSLPSITVRGNQDRALIDPAVVARPASTLEFVRTSLRTEHLAWLAALPTTVQMQDGSVFLCHGTPRSDEEHLLEEIRAEGVFMRPAQQVTARLTGVDAEVTLCAHSHVPRTVQAEGRLVLNPGSVGLPAYTDEAPFAHAMESGSPHARYALLTRHGAAPHGWRVEHVAVPYDWQAAADAAYRHGRPDWAEWIRTGRATVAV